MWKLSIVSNFLFSEKELLDNLELQGSNETEDIFVKTVYKTKLNYYSGSKQQIQCFPALESNLDHCTAEAENLFYQCGFTQSYKLTQE